MKIEFLEMAIMPEVLALPFCVAFCEAESDDGEHCRILAIQFLVFNFAWRIGG